ncbi:MAG: hypothetical protein E5X67_23750 [Mesorhizobium sp.]|uniref:hypothetical protein n=1 Tax=Mesorhizobium sp. TaxID=1871066 RepID=UPI001224290D|nr:hypothetical protein [Mesorhizobium sp.]TIP25675.1 MAG: hypothetical protein E5X67_23750 [Mesorhizobium sp.]
MLMAKLASLWPADQPHLPIADLKKWFASYVYLPKLRGSAVLESAIAEGVSTSDPLFGYADGYNEATVQYEGLAFGRLAPTVFQPGSLIVRKEVAAETSRPVSAGTGAGMAPVVGSAEPGDGQPGQSGGRNEPSAQPTNRKPGRFFGVVEIDTIRPIKSFETIVNAVVAELQRRPGAKITLTLDIDATPHDGCDENDVGVIRDNTKQL